MVTLRVPVPRKIYFTNKLGVQDQRQRGHYGRTEVGPLVALPQGPKIWTEPGVSCRQCCPIFPTLVSIGEKVFFSSTSAYTGPADHDQSPPAAISHGKVRQKTGARLGGRWVLGISGPGTGTPEKFILSTKWWYKTSGVGMWPNVDGILA